MASMTSDTSNTSGKQPLKHNAKKNTTRARGPFLQSITAILTEEKKREAVY